MDEPTVFICRIDTPEGIKDFVTLLPPEVAFSKGLAPEAIIGVLLRSLGPGESITPGVFARNRVFVDFMHDVIRRYAPNQPGFQAEARRQGSGWVYVIDQRTPTPSGPVPPEDIIGAFQVENGRVVDGSYHANSRHMILSPIGFYRLGHELHQCLLHELTECNSRTIGEKQIP